MKAFSIIAAIISTVVNVALTAIISLVVYRELKAKYEFMDIDIEKI